MPPSSGLPESRLCPTPSVLMAFYTPAGSASIITAAWVGIICSRPSVLSLTLKRSIEKVPWLPAGGNFSVNLPREEILGLPLFKDLFVLEDDRLSGLGLRLAKGLVSPAPVIEGCPIRIECRQVSSKMQFDQETVSGEVLAIQVDEQIHGVDAPVDLCRMQSFLQRAHIAGLPLARRLPDPAAIA